MFVLKSKTYFFVCIILLCCLKITAQVNSINIKAKLDVKNDLLHIQQKTVFFNQSSTNLKKLYLHNWANSYIDNETPLGKRFIEDYKNDFYFSKDNDRGFSYIKNLAINYKLVPFKEKKNQPDVIEISLTDTLKPQDSLTIFTSYFVKIPNAKYTGYGKTKTGYHLRFWYITPAVFNENWQIMSNLNLDDLYEKPSSYTISIDVPKNYHIESNLYQYKTEQGETTNFYLVGQKKKDIILHIDTVKTFKSFKTKDKEVKTDAYLKDISNKETTEIINRQIQFIEDFLGKTPHPEILVDARTVNKNSLHEIYGIPRWLKPFPKNFRWETGFFKALTQKYFDDVIILNTRKDYWLTDGLQTFLMMEYIKKYYPDVPILGKYANNWLIKSYNLSKLKQNDKYAFVYQFSARKFYDQPLTTPSDSLSNFNRKVVSKYKAGLGFKYLQDFVGDSVLKKSIREYYFKNQLKLTSGENFATIIQQNTSKDLRWFFGDYINTNKKIDYKIKKVKYSKNKDSLNITIKNKRNFTAPVALYGIQKKKVKFKTWVTNIESIKTIKIKRGDFDKLALNYENNYPEFNYLDNFRNVNDKLINKPLQFRFFKDVENPYYNQFFYYPDIKYNLYDGLILGVNINNRPIINHNFEFSITPNYGTKSKNLTGSFVVAYNHFLKKSSLYKIRYGIGGSNFHYAPELGYNTLTPFVSFQFRRNTLRDIGSKFFLVRLVGINKEVVPDDTQTDQDKYNIFNLRYINNKYTAIQDIRYAFNAEINSNFNKISTDIRYRKLFTTNESYEVRFFGGLFLTNDTEGDYFSFGLNRGNDYLFEQNLFGRSENEGIFSQQFVTDQGGFKSKFKNPHYANQFISSINTSISVWKWAEIYNDVAMLKNKNTSPKFFYENGIRLNFLPDIFEFYLPIYTNEGFEINKGAYPSKIRFIITTDIDRIYNFFRRGLL
ncbi:gluzincin family metallopeptidase [Tenacibaculum caenipelagi]|uniref:Aminopeptidase n=1 Tax=Tenacibaculum caenipelagi TaxID=1325435 RepID=A0A4R6TBE2_9FLAO|nr:aminopeptidase [Tenacibaculum caenipelagi]TDQ23978.1 hypothetical protein DFQ07_2517 [Tenacibaculum caenipelagi]